MKTKLYFQEQQLHTASLKKTKIGYFSLITSLTTIPFFCSLQARYLSIHQTTLPSIYYIIPFLITGLLLTLCQCLTLIIPIPILKYVWSSKIKSKLKVNFLWFLFQYVASRSWSNHAIRSSYSERTSLRPFL